MATFTQAPAQILRGLADVVSMARKRPQSWLLAGLMFSACGRTDFEIPAADEPSGDIEVEMARELVLEDAAVVTVELVSPAPAEATLALTEMEDGLTLDDIVEGLCPDGEPSIEVDATQDPPVMHVWRDGDLRALVWL